MITQLGCEHLLASVFEAACSRTGARSRESYQAAAQAGTVKLPAAQNSPSEDREAPQADSCSQNMGYTAGIRHLPCDSARSCRLATACQILLGGDDLPPLKCDQWNL
jgi:hypothetical protein